MPQYWRISDRAIRNGEPSSTERGLLSFWTSDDLANDGTLAWQKVGQPSFQAQLKACADALNPNNDAQQEDQPHVTFFVHGFNVSWGQRDSRIFVIGSRRFMADAMQFLDCQRV